MKVLTLGSGFVADHLPYDKIHERVALDWRHIGFLLNTYQPDVLVNCIGKTGRPNVDWCENNREETSAANTALPIMLADACAKRKIRLIQLGSGCIYFGPSPHLSYVGHGTNPDPGWSEDDFANPKSYYSKSKYACDLVLGQMDHVTTLRLRMPVSEKDNPRNLINKLRGYNQVINIHNSMTFMTDLVRCIEWAVQGDVSGIFHVTNPQPLTAARIMKEYQKYVPEHQFELITENQLDQMTVAKRSNCILSTEKLHRAGFDLTDSEEALEICMANYVKNMRANDVK